MTRSRFIGAEAWDTLTPDQQKIIGAIALEYIVNCNGADAYAGKNMTVELRPFERADSILMDMLHQHVADALGELVPSIHDESLAVPVPSLLGPVCRTCGRSEFDPCVDSVGWCGWTEPDLCTSCSTDDERTNWKIRIAGYGTFDFHGTEDEAEAMRKHKCQWEQGIGHKYRADLARESDRIGKQICEIFDRGKGAPAELFDRRRDAFKIEAEQ